MNGFHAAMEPSAWLKPPAGALADYFIVAGETEWFSELDHRRDVEKRGFSPRLQVGLQSDQRRTIFVSWAKRSVPNVSRK